MSPPAGAGRPKEPRPTIATNPCKYCGGLIIIAKGPPCRARGRKYCCRGCKNMDQVGKLWAPVRPPK